MSHPVTRRRPRPRAGRAALLGLALALAAACLAAVVARGVLGSLACILTAFAGIDLPRWIHNLADLLQIVTAVIAFLAWEGARRRGRRE